GSNRGFMGSGLFLHGNYGERERGCRWCTGRFAVAQRL
ncbi:MAG: hypothetical protein AVDCRST_MAG28-1505, partial [uncultured Rubrobacteraceae bacterium]